MRYLLLILSLVAVSFSATTKVNDKNDNIILDEGSSLIETIPSTNIQTFNNTKETFTIFGNSLRIQSQTSIDSPQGIILFQSDAIINSLSRLDINSLNIKVPTGYSATYGVISFSLTITARSFATVYIVFPKPIPQGSRVYKLVGTTLYDITSMVDIRGSTITFRIDDNSIYDANNNLGIIEDPIILLENQSPPTGGGGGGCSAGAGGGFYGWLVLLVFALLRRLKG